MLHAGPLCVTQDTETEVTTCRQGYLQGSATNMREGCITVTTQKLTHLQLQVSFTESGVIFLKMAAPS